MFSVLLLKFCIFYHRRSRPLSSWYLSIRFFLSYFSAYFNNSLLPFHLFLFSLVHAFLHHVVFFFNHDFLSYTNISLYFIPSLPTFFYYFPVFILLSSFFPFIILQILFISSPNSFKLSKVVLSCFPPFHLVSRFSLFRS